MKIKADQLKYNLDKELKPVYLAFGDEPLQVSESCDAIREKARSEGFSERKVLDIDRYFKWNLLFEESRAMSLFSDKRIIELRMPTGKPGKEGSAAIAEYCNNPAPDTLLLIVCESLEYSSQSTKWFKATDKIGGIIQSWVIDRSYLPGWIVKRAKTEGVNLDRQSSEVLADLLEGNLMACAQEILKLGLLHGNKAISPKMIEDSITDAAKFTIYSLTDDALAGNATHAIRTISSLRKEGVEPILVLWALNKEIRSLFEMKSQILKGDKIDQVLKKHRVWKKREAAVKSALNRHSKDNWMKLAEEAISIDNVVKGMRPGSSWTELLRLTLSLAGKPIFTADNEPEQITI